MALRLSCYILAVSLAISMWQNETLRRQLASTAQMLVLVTEQCR